MQSGGESTGSTTRPPSVVHAVATPADRTIGTMRDRGVTLFHERTLMASTTPTAAPPEARASRTRNVPSFEPTDPVDRVLNRIKGEGRRRIVAGLTEIGVPLSRIPGVLLRPDLTAFEYAVISRCRDWPIEGERLPGLLRGEVEAARVVWELPSDARTIVLRARPHLGGAAWRIVDDYGNDWALLRTWGPWPATDRDMVALLDEATCPMLLQPLGAFRTVWNEARRLDFDRRTARECVLTRTILRGRRLREAVDDLFGKFWPVDRHEDDPEGDDDAPRPEVVQ
jgi:hypothetical protein